MDTGLMFFRSFQEQAYVCSFAMSGDIIEAIYVDENGTDSGAAYLLVCDVAWAWSEQYKMVSSDGAPYALRDVDQGG